MAGKVSSHVRSNVVGYIALFFALGLGTAWAATELEKNEVKSKHLKNGGVKTKDLANDAVTSPKVANGSLLGEDFAAGQLPQGERGPEGPEGADGPTGPRGVQGEPGSAKGYARVLHTTGEADPNRSKGVVDVQLVTDTNGDEVADTAIYCFDLSFVPHTAVGSTFINNAAIVATSTPPDSGVRVNNCPAGHQDAAAKVYDAAGTPHADVTFDIVFP